MKKTNFLILLLTMLFGLGQASWAQEVVEISTVEQLKEFRDAVNAGNQYAGKTVKLIADLDLSSESNWKPIGNLVSYPGQSFNGTFDGDGHIISNLTVNDNTPNYAVAGLFGSVVSGTVKNLTIKNVNLKSTHYAGAIVAYTSNNPTVENCHVIGGTITSTPELINGKYDNGDKVGGIFGYATTGSTIKNCSVEGVTIRGYRDIGGVAGFTGGSVTNCSVKDIILIQDNTNGYKEGDMSSTVGEVVGGRSANAVDVNKNNEKENVTIKRAGLGVAQIGDKLYKTLDEAVAAATEGQTILIIEAGDYELPNLPKNVTIKGAADGIVSFTHTSKGSIASVPNGATFNNVIFNWGNVDYNGFQHAGTINMENCTLNGRLSSYGDMNFTDCKFVQDNSDYNMWVYGAGNVVYDKCTFTGKGKLLHLYCEGPDLVHKVTVKDCKFVNSGSQNKAAINVKATSTRGALKYELNLVGNNTCEGEFPTAVGEQDNEDKTWILSPLAQVDDRKVSPDSITVIENGKKIYPVNYVASIGDKKYESLQDAFNAAADGETVKMLCNVELSDKMTVSLADRSVVLDLDGKTLTGRTNLVSGNLTIKNGSVEFEGGQPLNVYGSPDVGASDYSVLTISKDVTVSGDYGVCMFGSEASKNGYGAVVNIAGTLKGKEGTVFVSGNLGTNVEDDMNNIVNITGTVEGNGNAGVALNGNATVNVKGGAKITGNTAVAIKRGCLNVEAGAEIHSNGEMNLHPKANNNGTEMTGAAISMTDTYNKYGGMSVTITGGTITSDNAPALFKKDAEYANAATIAVSGGIFSSAVLPEFCAEGFIPADLGDGRYSVKKGSYVASIGDKKYESLQEAVDAAADGDIVKLLKDINLNSEFVNIDKTVTINGDGHTITSDAAQAILLKGSGDVTLSNTKVVASKGHGIQVGDDDAYSGKLVLNENSILTVAKRGIRVFKEDTGFGITIDNSTIQSSKKDPKTTYTTGNDAIGLSLAATDGKGYDVNINNTIIQGFSYDINGTTSGSNLNVTMTGGATYGRAVLNVWGSNNNFTLNGVDVHGLNNQTGPTEAFSCIVENENAHDNQYTIKDCPFTATLSEAAMTAEGSTASEQMIDLRGANSTVKVLGSTTYICNSDERGGFIYSEIALMNNKLYFDDTTKATFANAFEEAVISDEKDAEVGLYPVNYIPEVYYYWIDEGNQNGVYCKLAEPFAEGWLSDGEFIALQKDVKLTDNIVCKLGEDTSFTILLGDHKLTKGSYSIVINKGVTVKTDKSAKVFSSSVDGYIVKETKIEDGYSYSLEEASVMYTDEKGKVTYYATVPNSLRFGVYKLLKDVTVDKCMAPAFFASDVTIDLNGYTLTSNATDCGFLLTRSQHKFSIVDNSENGGGHLITKENAIMINGKGYDVSIGKGVIIDGCISMFKSDNTLNVEGTINGGDYFAIVTNGNQTTSGTINIKEGAALTSNTIAMYLPGKADVNIEGGDISGSTGIYMKSGKLNVTGGNITGNGEKKGYQYYGNGAYSTGNALAIDNCGYPGGIPDVNISGGTFTSKNNDAIGSYAYGDERESVKKFISGGYFSNEVSQELCAEGYVSVKADDKEGYFTVVTKEDAGIFELNDNDTEYPYCEGRVATKISYKRTFMRNHVNKYQAWFVPFDYTITNEDEENFQFYKIHLIAASAEVEVHDNTKVYVYIEPIGEGTVLKGNRPYVVKPKKELTDYVFVAENINKLYSEDSSSRLHQETTEFEYDFYGTFRKVKFIEENQVLYLDGGKIVWNSSDNTVRTYRWYIKTTSKDNDNYAKPDIIFIEEGNEPTGIEINDTIGDGIIGIYTSNGIKVDNPVKGINIIRYADGKTRKIYIK